MLIKKFTDFRKRFITSAVAVVLLLSYTYFVFDTALGESLIGILFFILYSEMLIACYTSKSPLWKKILVFAFSWFYLVLGLAAMWVPFLRGFPLQFIASVCCIDISAYMIGSMLKGPKLAPKISPNKTISGFVGALVVGVIMFELLISSFVCSDFNVYTRLLIALIFTLSVQLGDLLVSFIKRILQVKDFSQLLPGHGGVWDRFDSIFAGAIMLFILNIILGVN